MRAFVAGFFLLCLAANAEAQTAEQVAAVERASAVGWELYQHDQAAWHGTDAMLAEVRDPRAEGFAGWITERSGDGVALTFVRRAGEDLFAAYRSLYRDGAIRETGRVDRPLTQSEARLYRARQIAIAAIPSEQCARTYNTVALPRTERGADGADIDVYLMPAFEDLKVVPFGGHFRLAVASEAEVVRETARFTNGCLAAPIESDTAGLVISQLIGDTPTEIHFFLSLTAGINIAVSSRSGLWSIEGREFRYLDAPASPGDT